MENLFIAYAGGLAAGLAASLFVPVADYIVTTIKRLCA